ncbi:multicopper oxidase family protein [Salisediminibacterium beveridgei]|uniref:Multicopper oxidase n=1 Tax=Salisediminibacterium beveridgei TaxID=632773 RepID=A0A1D7QYL1_9BACI|nr:multicopper oxidase domain-containing protein [Salisediminibacterium beveridgei]AOM84090.1 Multicopper oxidase [Salisediminibacterium beveridgei]
MNKNGLLLGALLILGILLGMVISHSMTMDQGPGMSGDETQRQNTTDDSEASEDALTDNENRNDREIPLPIPPVLEDENPEDGKAEFTLTAQIGETEFYEGQPTETYGYNGDYLGPVLRVREGDEVTVNVENALEEETTVHWHGLEVPGEADGGPHSVIEPGGIWRPEFEIKQPASTLWFHPHPHHKTGEQVYKGLAGLLLIEDDASDGLDIPKDYGENDIPLIVQDKELKDDGTFDYNPGMQDIMMGLHGNTPLVNGAVDPYTEVPQGKMRFRVLNGSNARTYDFELSGGQSFHQIASDGGFLEKPVEMNNLTLSSAERAELIVDFSDFEEGDQVELRGEGTRLMTFEVTGEDGFQTALPKQLVDIEQLDPADADVTRQFVMGGMGPHVNINGRQMDMDRIDEEVTLNDIEVWEISNESQGMMGGMMGGMGERGMIHPFHIHGIQFQVLDRNGEAPPENERGWKDTVLVQENETVRIIAKFSEPGVFMYHCHILEHEDVGMMGQFEVK